MSFFLALFSFLEAPQETLEAMLETASLVDLRGHIQSILVLNSLKLYCKVASKWFSEATGEDDLSTTLDEVTLESTDPYPLIDRLLELTTSLMDKLSLFVHSADLEVQERVRVSEYISEP